jgi:hypothetical protein
MQLNWTKLFTDSCLADSRISVTIRLPAVVRSIRALACAIKLAAHMLSRRPCRVCGVSVGGARMAAQAFPMPK